MADDKLYRISHDLRIISCIRENNRIYTDNSKLKIDMSSKPVSALSRYLAGQDRYKNVDIIQNLIDDTFLYIDSMLKYINDNVAYKERERVTSIIGKLKVLLMESTNGLRNLRITYQHDTSTRARLYDIEDRILRDLVSRGLFSDNSIYSKVNSIEDRLIIIED